MKLSTRVRFFRQSRHRSGCAPEMKQLRNRQCQNKRQAAQRIAGFLAVVCISVGYPQKEAEIKAQEMQAQEAAIKEPEVRETEALETVAEMQENFRSFRIEGEVLERISGKSYVDNPDIALEELRYLKVLHYNFDHEIQEGELIVNAELAEEFLEIFEELFEAEYEIQSLRLIDDYWTGDGISSDDASVEANNSSAFCYRKIAGSDSLSNHALGRAIDINPQQNPYVSYSTGEPVWDHENASDYVNRESGREHMITQEDLCYQVFTEHGFIWGGDWNNPKDYQHFEYKTE